VHKKTSTLTVVLYEDSKYDERINAVVKEYGQLLRSHKSSDIPALIQAGICTLQNEGEALESIIRISNMQCHRNPLSDWKSAIEEVGVLRFFQNITYQQYMTPGKLDEIIRNLRSTSK